MIHRTSAARSGGTRAAGEPLTLHQRLRTVVDHMYGMTEFQMCVNDNSRRS
jgi:hypothetical protein